MLAAFSGAGDLYRDWEWVVVLSESGCVDDVLFEEEGCCCWACGLWDGDGRCGAASTCTASASEAWICVDNPRPRFHHARIDDVASLLHAFEVTTPPNRSLG